MERHSSVEELKRELVNTYRVPMRPYLSKVD